MKTTQRLVLNVLFRARNVGNSSRLKYSFSWAFLILHPVTLIAYSWIMPSFYVKTDSRVVQKTTLLCSSSVTRRCQRMCTFTETRLRDFNLSNCHVDYQKVWILVKATIFQAPCKQLLCSHFFLLAQSYHITLSTLILFTADLTWWDCGEILSVLTCKNEVLLIIKPSKALLLVSWMPGKWDEFFMNCYIQHRKEQLSELTIVKNLFKIISPKNS